MKKQIAVQIQPNYKNSFSRKWIEYINSTNDFRAKLVSLKEPDAIGQVMNCAGVMWHFRHTPEDKQIAPRILMAIENMLHISVFPDLATRWHFDEKVSQYYLLQAAGIPMVPTWVFWSQENAIDFLETTDEYPLVFKLSCGAGGSNVIKLDSKSDALPFVEKMFGSGIFPYTENEFQYKSMEGDPNYPDFRNRMQYAGAYLFKKEMPPLPWYYCLQKDYLYLQKFLPNNENDIRVTVIGNRAFGFIRRNRKNDFRASGSGMIHYDPRNIPMEAVRVAYQLAEKIGTQSAALDMLFDESGKVVVSEVCYGYSAKAVYDCPGYWDRDLNWHEGHFWPQEAQAEDFLNLIRNRENQ